MVKGVPKNNSIKASSNPIPLYDIGLLNADSEKIIVMQDDNSVINNLLDVYYEKIFKEGKI